MIYRGHALGADLELAIEKEGLRLGRRFIDFADVAAILPMNHRVLVDTLGGERVEISMLGFSYDGFWEELLSAFSARNLAALFVEDTPLMLSEGEYRTLTEQGRGKLGLYPDAVCILPQTEHAVRIPLCFAETIRQDGYWLEIALESGASYRIGKMGYDSQPFFERATQRRDTLRKERRQRSSALHADAPFTQTGLFRTTQEGLSWQAAYGKGCCAVELFTGDDAATYVYRFPEPQSVFSSRLEEAMEATGSHREIIYWSDEQLAEKPLYRMAVRRCPAVSFLRERSAGRLIHNASHAQRLEALLRE